MALVKFISILKVKQSVKRYLLQYVKSEAFLILALEIGDYQAILNRLELL